MLDIFVVLFVSKFVVLIAHFDVFKVAFYTVCLRLTVALCSAHELNFIGVIAPRIRIRNYWETWHVGLYFSGKFLNSNNHLWQYDIR